MNKDSLILWFNQVGIKDIALVGGKNASLGEMTQNLSSLNIKVPNGFAITTHAYKQFLDINNLNSAIEKALLKIEKDNVSVLEETSIKIKNLIKQGKFSDECQKEILKNYEKLKENDENLRVAVRSSASAEDLPGASFAGQQESFLHVSSFKELIEKTILVYASLFTARAISYRLHYGFKDLDVNMSVGIQKMVNSDQALSGVMFSIDPETGFKDLIFINASYGLGESIVQGQVNPDEYLIYKPLIQKGQLLVLASKIGSKEKKLVYEQGEIKEVIVLEKQRNILCLSKADLEKLAHDALVIEEHYKKPMDIEWAKDSFSKEIFIVQARPETVSQKELALESYHLKNKSKVLCKGRAVGRRIAKGVARILKDFSDAKNFKKGDVLVTDMTDPAWEPIMQIASAIVTNRGGRTCHAAIIARELNIAAVVGCHDATKNIKDGSFITVSCAEGDTGYIYEGLLDIEKKSMPLKNLEIGTDLMLIAANPQKAFSYHQLPHKGIGLARLEFIIAHNIGIHPNAILWPEKITKEIHEKILTISASYSSAKEFYIEELAKGICSLAAVSKPHPIILRLSDFKTNEYEELLGGKFFENKENNPMIGFRGASRYLSPKFEEAFSLECEAIKKARHEFGFKNIQIMVPFVRTLKEAESVINLLAKNGLTRGKDDLKIIMMCEVPSNVILAKEFLQFFDGFSIGSNDLTQLSLGIDRDSEQFAKEFNESDPCMLKMFETAIKACKDNNKYVGICGQGPSDDLTLAQFLLKLGIDSISVNPDSFLNVYQALGKSS